MAWWEEVLKQKTRIRQGGKGRWLRRCSSYSKGIWGMLTPRERKSKHLF
jgi:hypothetical protein